MKVLFQCEIENNLKISTSPLSIVILTLNILNSTFHHKFHVNKVCFEAIIKLQFGI